MIILSRANVNNNVYLPYCLFMERYQDYKLLIQQNIFILNYLRSSPTPNLAAPPPQFNSLLYNFRVKLLKAGPLLTHAFQQLNHLWDRKDIQMNHRAQFIVTLISLEKEKLSSAIENQHEMIHFETHPISKIQRVMKARTICLQQIQESLNSTTSLQFYQFLACLCLPLSDLKNTRAVHQFKDYITNPIVSKQSNCSILFQRIRHLHKLTVILVNRICQWKKYILQIYRNQLANRRRLVYVRKQINLLASLLNDNCFIADSFLQNHFRFGGANDPFLICPALFLFETQRQDLLSLIIPDQQDFQNIFIAYKLMAKQSQKCLKRSLAKSMINLNKELSNFPQVKRKFIVRQKLRVLQLKSQKQQPKPTQTKSLQRHANLVRESKDEAGFRGASSLYSSVRGQIKDYVKERVRVQLSQPEKTTQIQHKANFTDISIQNSITLVPVQIQVSNLLKQILGASAAFDPVFLAIFPYTLKQTYTNRMLFFKIVNQNWRGCALCFQCDQFAEINYIAVPNKTWIVRTIIQLNKRFKGRQTQINLRVDLNRPVHNETLNHLKKEFMNKAVFVEKQDKYFNSVKILFNPLIAGPSPSVSSFRVNLQMMISEGISHLSAVGSGVEIPYLLDYRYLLTQLIRKFLSFGQLSELKQSFQSEEDVTKLLKQLLKLQELELKHSGIQHCQFKNVDELNSWARRKHQTLYTFLPLSSKSIQLTALSLTLKIPFPVKSVRLFNRPYLQICVNSSLQVATIANQLIYVLPTTDSNYKIILTSAINYLSGRQSLYKYTNNLIQKTKSATDCFIKRLCLPQLEGYNGSFHNLNQLKSIRKELIVRDRSGWWMKVGQGVSEEQFEGVIQGGVVVCVMSRLAGQQAIYSRIIT